MDYLIPLIGCFGLIFRIWLTEVKLRKELDFRRYYLSRIVNICLFIAMIYNFESMTFNMILVTSTPILMVASIFWDTRFYKRLPKVEQWQEKKNWLLLERVTLHPPILILGIIPYFSSWFPHAMKWGALTFHSFKEFAVGSIGTSGPFMAKVIALFYASILIYGALFVLDIRWYERKGWPTAKYMLIATIVMCAIIFPWVLIP
ncbi:MAG: hypothetical protein ACTSU2_12385 [Promethearchaeota archaeon]